MLIQAERLRESLLNHSAPPNLALGSRKDAFRCHPSAHHCALLHTVWRRRGVFLAGGIGEGISLQEFSL